jgi:twinkle protein
VFDDGHAYCFACKHYIRAEGTEPVAPKKVKMTNEDWRPANGQMRELAHRGINQRTTRKFRYKQSDIKGLGYCEVADYVVDGKLVAQHIRTKNKDFRWFGDFKQVRLWGQDMWRRGGNRIIVTEGEIDAMTVWQVMGEKWPVVSIPNGVSHAADAIRNSLEFLSSYKEVVLCFDSDPDGQGQESAVECAQLLPAGKAKIVSLPYKDPNAMLLKGETKALLNALWDAQTYRPDGIIHVKDIPDDEDEDQQIWPYPWRDVTRALVGQRSGEMVMWTSGTGMGKSTVIRTLVHHHLNQGRKVGVCMLEESLKETRDDLISLAIGKPVRQIRASRRLNKAMAEYDEEAIDFGITDDLTDEEYLEARVALAEQPLILYDHEGAKDYEGILSKIEYMTVSLGCDVVVLDHVTAVVAATEYNGKGERRGIDELMGNLRSLISRTGVHLDIVSQLRKPDGKPYEEGGKITSADLRGSGSLASVPNVIIAIERNQQHPDVSYRNTVIMRVLKNRFFGDTGIVAALKYHKSTMVLEPVEWNEAPDGTLSFGPQLIDEEYITDDESEPDFLSSLELPDPDAIDGSELDLLGQETVGEGQPQTPASSV